MTNSFASAKARRGARRALTSLAAVATAGLLALGAAAPASADTETNSGGARGEYKGQGSPGSTVQTSKGALRTTLFTLHIDGGTELLAYCIDADTSIKKTKYREDDWETYDGKGKFAEREKLHWILQNSYPNVSESELGSKAGVRSLSQKDAIAGTQAAIWHFSNGTELENRGNSNSVMTVYQYLVNNAEDLPQTAEPTASLQISPHEASGEPGGPIGDFTVSTTADSVPLILDGPAGVEVRDIEGHVIDSIGDGQRFTVTVPEDAEDGEATVTSSVKSTVQTGRLFRGALTDVETQTLITAQSNEATVEAGVRVTWTKPVEQETPSPTPSPSETPSETPSPTPSETPPADKTPPAETPPAKPTPDDKPGLPVTGAALGGLIAAAAVAVGGGGAAMYLSRKRKSGHSS